MLQSAASDAHSWWWASNIRTKQSKWLDSNLQEMEEKMKTVIKLIEVDADSFAKKAEMYYQRRPELIKFVEETYKAYKALADRYDRISGELHKANHTLASAFPDQFQFAMQDDDEDDSSSGFTPIDPSKFRKSLHREVPQINLRNRSPEPFSALKKHHKNASSDITKENAQREIDRLQKEILFLQTEKEFVKGSYESCLAKFWEIENRITDLQDQICSWQDECSASSCIEDDEARALMAATAIKSCEKRLVALQQQQRKSGEEAEMESKRIREANNRIKFLKGEQVSPEIENFDKETNVLEQSFHPKNEDQDLCSVGVQVKEQFEMNPMTPVVDLTEKIDELVEKVISLEVTILSQMAQIQTLRSETDGLQKHLQDLEEDRANLITDSNGLNARLRQAEDELHRVQELEKVMHDEKSIFQTHFVEAYNSLTDISGKLQSSRYGEKDSRSTSSNIENSEKTVVKEKGAEDDKCYATAQEDEVHVKEVVSNAKSTKDQSHSDEISTRFINTSEKLKAEQLSARILALLKDTELDDRENIPDWLQLLNCGSEGRQTMYHFEMMALIQELKSGNAVKDQEIWDLKNKLFSLTSSNGATSLLKQDQMFNKEGNGGFTPKLTAKSDSLDTEEEVKVCHFEQQHPTSLTEEKYRAVLDTLLDENLDFWRRFSASYHHIQKFEASFKELQDGLDKLKDFSKEGRSAPASTKQDTVPLDKKMREFHTELQVWLDQNALLKEELQRQFTSLCNIHEEISKSMRDLKWEGTEFTPYQAAKFQGELRNMKQENDKVAKELQAGLDHVKALRSDVAKALLTLRESFDFVVSNGYQQYQNFRHCSTKSMVPLRTFLLGEKRKKPSIFSCISTALHRSHNQMKPGFSSR